MTGTTIALIVGMIFAGEPRVNLNALGIEALRIVARDAMEERDSVVGKLKAERKARQKSESRVKELEAEVDRLMSANAKLRADLTAAKQAVSELSAQLETLSKTPAEIQFDEAMRTGKPYKGMTLNQFETLMRSLEAKGWRGPTGIYETESSITYEWQQCRTENQLISSQGHHMRRVDIVIRTRSATFELGALVEWSDRS